MHTDSVDTDSPPGQEPPADHEPLASWPAFGGETTLEPTGENTAELWYTSHARERTKFGGVQYDRSLDRFIVAWNSSGRMMYGSYQIEAMDHRIHALMARRMR